VPTYVVLVSNTFALLIRLLFKIKAALNTSIDISIVYLVYTMGFYLVCFKSRDVSHSVWSVL